MASHLGEGGSPCENGIGADRVGVAHVKMALLHGGGLS